MRARASASAFAESFGSVPFQTAAIASPSFAGWSETNARLWSGVAEATYVTRSWRSSSNGTGRRRTA